MQKIAAKSMFMKAFLTASTVFACIHPAVSHEYWVEPIAYELKRGDSINANMKNGTDFRGTSYPYISSEIVTFEATTSAGKTPITGRDGDRPAVALKTSSNGLHAVSFFNTASTIVFNDYEKFKSYFVSEGAEKLITRHEELGFPKEKIKEVYSRCAKALVQVGDADAQDLDQHTGMPAELIALQNPYALEAGKPIQVKMTWMEKPYGNAQVRVFEKLGEDADGKPVVTETRPRTNKDGIISFIPKAGAEYLLSSVVIIDNKSPFFMEDTDAHWESYWASLTFKSPK